jgi:molybdenum cofactor cytidylyltransferase
MISAIVLAAGLSTRMGTQKLLLPWGDTTVIGNILFTLKQAGLSDIGVVTGRTYAEVEKLILEHGARLLFNQDYANGEMLTSLQVGLRDLGNETEAILVVLGDQPQIEGQVVKEIMLRFEANHHPIIVPSYEMHRGHPWLLGKAYWAEVLALRAPLTLRDFLNSHHEVIDYLTVTSPSILQDLDTREDYSTFKP